MDPYTPAASTRRVSPEAVQAALADWRAALGDAHVRDTPEAVDRAAKASVPAPLRPAALLYPGSREEVVALVQIAARHGVPIWPVSQGRNWGYGSYTAPTEDTVLVILERLNRILGVDETLATAIVEPGVTFRQLRAHLEAHHPTLWSDATDGPPEGSVLGNALDRGLGVTPYADRFGTLCGMEVVLPDGELVRTGGGPADCATWNTHKWGVGPYLEGLFSQSGFGVVVQAGIWLMRKPEAFCTFTFDLRRPEDLPRLIDALRELALEGSVAAGFHLLNEVASLAVLWQAPAELRGPRPADLIQARCRALGVAPWSLSGGLHGTRAQVAAHRRALSARLKPLGTLMFVTDDTIRAVRALNRMAAGGGLGGWLAARVYALAGKSRELFEVLPHLHTIRKGIPGDAFVRQVYLRAAAPRPDQADPDQDDVGFLWFAPAVPMTGEHVDRALSLCRARFGQHGFDFYAVVMMHNPRTALLLTCIFFEKQDPDEARRAKALYTQLMEDILAAGYAPYRVSVGGMARLAQISPAFTRLARRLKAAIDPSGVMAPGRYGV